MKKILFLAAALFAFGLFSNAQAAQELPLVGEYVNDAGYLVIAKAANGQDANYDVGIVDKSGKCNLQIVCGTWKTSETTSVPTPTQSWPWNPRSIPTSPCGPKMKKFALPKAPCRSTLSTPPARYSRTIRSLPASNFS